METKRRQRNGVVETIVFLQSVLLLSFGLAGIMSSSVIISGFDAITDANSAVYFITDDKVVTENTELSTTDTKSIINNFQLICTTSLTIGTLVFAASLVRLVRIKRQSK